MTDIILSGIINVNGLEIPTNTKPPQISKLNKQYMVENFEDTDLILKFHWLDYRCYKLLNNCIIILETWHKTHNVDTMMDILLF